MTVAHVNETTTIRNRRRRGLAGALMQARLLVLGSAAWGVSLGLVWLEQEGRHATMRHASRESPVVRAGSLQPLEKTTPSDPGHFTMGRGGSATSLPPPLTQSPPSASAGSPVWLLADGTVSAERLRQILRDRGARQMGPAVRFAMLRVGELLGMTEQTWSASMATSAASENEASALLLTFYLYHLERGGDGAGVRAFRQALEQRMPLERAVSEFILAGRSVAEFEGEMGRLYRRAGIELQFTRRGGGVFKP